MQELDELRFRQTSVEFERNSVKYLFEKAYGNYWRVFCMRKNGWYFIDYLLRSGDDESGKALYADYIGMYH